MNTCKIHAKYMLIQTVYINRFHPHLYSDSVCISMYLPVYVFIEQVLVCILQTQYWPILTQWRKTCLIGSARISTYNYVLKWIEMYWHVLTLMSCIYLYPASQVSFNALGWSDCQTLPMGWCRNKGFQILASSACYWCHEESKPFLPSCTSKFQHSRPWTLPYWILQKFGGVYQQ